MGFSLKVVPNRDLGADVIAVLHKATLYLAKRSPHHPNRNEAIAQWIAREVVGQQFGCAPIPTIEDCRGLETLLCDDDLGIAFTGIVGP